MDVAICDAMTRQLLHTWPVPAQEYRNADAWTWSFDSSALILPFEDAWLDMSPSDAVKSGFVVLTVASGACFVVSLPPSAQLPGNGQGHFEPAAAAGR